MEFAALFLAALGGVVEAIAGKAIEEGSALFRRRARMLALVEKQDLDSAEKAVQAAVEAARQEMLEAYTSTEDALQTDEVQDLVALLNHRPFAEEVSRVLLLQGPPNFERLQQVYLEERGASSARWRSLEPYLVEFFQIVEQRLLADPTLGPLLREMRTLTALLRMADDVQLIARASRILADATRQMSRLQRRTAEATESATGYLGRILELAGQQNATLRQIVQVLETIVAKLGESGSDSDLGGLSLTRGETTYLRLLRRECNRLPLAEESRAVGEPGQVQAELANVYVDLQTDAQPTLEQVFDRLEVPAEERPDLRHRMERRLKRAEPGETPDLDAILEQARWLIRLLERREDLDDHPLGPYVETEEELQDALANLTALEVLAAHRHLVLLGQPGSGKSTFVNHLAYVCAGQFLGEEDAGHTWLHAVFPEPLFPLRVVVRRWSATLKTESTPGLPLAYAALRAATGLDQETLERRLAQPDTLVLFDGLDEAPARDPDDPQALNRRRLVVESVQAFCTAHPDCRVLVTSRVKPYEQGEERLDGAPVARLVELDDARIRRFVRRWYAELARIDPDRAEQARQAEKRLLAALEQRRELREMAGTPLLLTMLAAVNIWAGLPESRAELYDRCVEQLLWEWEKKEDVDLGSGTYRPVLGLLDLLRGEGVELRRADVERVLWELTYQAHKESGSETADLPASLLREKLAAIHPRSHEGWAWADRVVTLMAERGGLLVESEPGVFTFPHRSFQEYLAARWLLEQEDCPQRAAKLAENDLWREVVLLACGYASNHSAYNQTQAILFELVAGLEVNTPEMRRRLLVAGQAWLEFGPHRAVGATGKTLQEQIPERLTQLMQNPEAPVEERLEAGELLARLGDPRKGVGVVPPPSLPQPGGGVPPTDFAQAEGRGQGSAVPDIDWVVIPAGPFTMGSDKRRDPLAWDDETPQFTCTLIQEPYRISRYPVTVAQYRCFVEAGGYRERRFWTKAGWAWREAEGITGPEEFGESFQRDNHPVVGVSWYEAVAYCRWLSEVLGYQVRLPTEAEWEKAARGEDGRIWPWGDEEPTAEHCNFDRKVGHTTPVGSYPRGASPYGVLDMAGNVWEWCSTKWRDDYKGYQKRVDDDLEGKALRVLRGGSWLYNLPRVRCAYRYGPGPNVRVNILGFRVVAPGL